VVRGEEEGIGADRDSEFTFDSFSDTRDIEEKIKSSVNADDDTVHDHIYRTINGHLPNTAPSCKGSSSVAGGRASRSVHERLLGTHCSIHVLYSTYHIISDTHVNEYIGV
jgi:hypothetical protein